MKANKLYLAIGLLSVVAFVALVAAWAFDTDGGYNIYQKGTCGDQFGNYTDSCISRNIPYELREWYPTNSTNGTTMCTSVVVACANYNSTCVNGACVPMNFSK